MSKDPLDMDPTELTEWERTSDEIVEMIYEDALCADEPWALEAFEYRQAHARR